jgi:ribosomal protein L37AE/L43A
MKKNTFACKSCKTDNVFNPKESIPYNFSCSYTFSNDYGFILKCSHCHSNLSYDAYMDFESINHYKLLDKQFERFQESQHFLYKVKQTIIKFLKIKIKCTLIFN